MKKLALIVAGLVSATSFSAARKVEITGMTVDYAPCPVTVGTGTPVFSWQIVSAKDKLMQKTYRIVAASSPENLKKKKYDVWDTGEIPSRLSAGVPYAGRKLESGEECWWKVILKTTRGSAESEPARFAVGLLSADDWKGEWIGTESPEDVLTGHVKIPARYLRKEFKTDGRVERATLYICGLGCYEAFLNGKRIGEGEVLTPTVSEYDKHVYYNTYDVTEDLSTGRNALGVVLEGGRYTSMRLGANDGIPDIRHYGLPRLLAQLEITYRSGKTARVVSDGTWTCSTEGPVRYGSEFDGEYYDAAREFAHDFSTTRFNDRKWAAVRTVDAPAGVLTAQPNPNICIQDRLTPVSVKRIGDKYILDMGQNMVGWLQIRAHGEPGRPVVLRFAETLREDGELYRDNLRKAEVIDHYVPKDRNPFVWHPSFTYHGFRYVEVSGLDYEPRPEDFEGQVFYDRMETTGSFETSDPVINAVYRNAFWGIRGNYRGMPTDCPQRDERMGWLGDRTTGCYGEAFIFGNHLLYAKWNRDICDSQREDGRIPDVCPAYWPIWGDSMTWPGAFLTTADMVWRQYGDLRPVREHYDAMKRWMVHMKKDHGKEGLITRDTYGDWCMPPESLELIHSKDPSRITDGALMSTAYYYKFCNLMQGFAALTRHDADVSYFKTEAIATLHAFNLAFFHEEEGFYGNNTVTANILPLAFGMVPEGREDDVFDRIVRKTEEDFGGHVSVGVIGIQYLMRTLTEHGRLDLAVRLASEKTYPSWGYMAEQGATTIWELWNGNTAAPEMNSGNHVMILGDLVIWFYEYLAGIKPAGPGFNKIRLQPFIPEKLDYVDCAYESLYGRIASSWKKTGDRFVWTFTIPANTTAEVWIPGETKMKEYGSGTYTVTGAL